MASTRSSQRRRRVILEEMVHTNCNNVEQPLSDPISVAREDLPAYSDSAKRRGHLKTTDLIPKRFKSLVMVILGVLCVFVGLNLLSTLSEVELKLNESATGPFRLRGTGTLSNWFSSMLFMVSGMASLQIYGMRRHRCDDYSGHYRIWLFLAIIFAAVSINFVVDIKAISALFVDAIGFSSGNNLVVFLLAKLVALTAIVVRGILEIRASRGALVTVAIVWLAYASAIVCQIPIVGERLVQNEEMTFGNLILVGSIATFLTTILYSRFVYLHANGLLRIQSNLILTEDSDSVRQTNGQSRENELPSVNLDRDGRASSDAEDQILSLSTVDSPKPKKSKKQSARKIRRAA